MTKNVNQFHANQEQARHNRVMETLTSQQNAETARSNAAKELETNRANRAAESNTAAYNYASNAHWSRQDAETRTHNRAQEMLTDQANTNTFVSQSEKNSVAKDEYAESVRSHKANEQEQRRHNEAQEMLTDQGNWMSLFGTLTTGLARAYASKRGGNTRGAAKSAAPKVPSGYQIHH